MGQQIRKIGNVQTRQNIQPVQISTLNPTESNCRLAKNVSYLLTRVDVVLVVVAAAAVAAADSCGTQNILTFM